MSDVKIREFLNILVRLGVYALLVLRQMLYLEKKVARHYGCSPQRNYLVICCKKEIYIFQKQAELPYI